MISMPQSTNLKLSPQVCAKLQTLGLRLSPLTELSHALLFKRHTHLYPGTLVDRIKIDSYSYISHSSTARLASIGRYCSIAHKVEIGMPQHDFSTLSASEAFTINSEFNAEHELIKRLDPFTCAHGDEVAPVTIEHDVWIGAGVYISNGVTIGTGAVIAAGSVITNDVPPYAIVAGRDGGENSKGIIKRYRFSDEVIADLLELKWWRFDLPKIMSDTQDFHRMPFDDVKAFISFMKNSDTSYWPRLDSKWFCLVPESASKAQVLTVDQNFTFGNSYTPEQCQALSWI